VHRTRYPPRTVDGIQPAGNGWTPGHKDGEDLDDVNDDPWRRGGGADHPQASGVYGVGPGGYAYPSYPPARPQPPRAPGLPAPVAVEVIPATPFAVAIVGLPPTTSGPAIAALVAGVGSILIAMVVGCFGVLGAQAGWGPTVAGAFAVLAALVGLAAVVFGVIGRRQVRRGDGGIVGRGIATAGVSCGIVGLLLTATGFVAAWTLVSGG
jgi:hypothetical protein